MDPYVLNFLIAQLVRDLVVRESSLILTDFGYILLHGCLADGLLQELA